MQVDGDEVPIYGNVLDVDQHHLSEAFGIIEGCGHAETDIGEHGGDGLNYLVDSGEDGMAGAECDLHIDGHAVCGRGGQEFARLVWVKGIRFQAGIVAGGG